MVGQILNIILIPNSYSSLSSNFVVFTEKKKAKKKNQQRPARRIGGRPIPAKYFFGIHFRFNFVKSKTFGGYLKFIIFSFKFKCFFFSTNTA